MTVSGFSALKWNDDRRPLISPSGLSPLVADPSFLFPEETPDGTWRLFAHTAFGIHCFSSADGTEWKNLGLIVWNAMRAFIRRFPDGYRLYYEKYRPLAMPMVLLPKRPKWKSRIQVRFSKDLVSWGPPRTLVEPVLPWQRDPVLGRSVGNPCVIHDGRQWRLYFSASLSFVPDCGFDEPRYIGMAVSDSPDGPFTVHPEPVIDPADDPLPGVLGAGSMKALKTEDGFIALQNKIYRDADGTSHSALFLLASKDGIRWEGAGSAPILAPDEGWRQSHVYACDARLREKDSTWYLYYNARDGWYKAEGRERIGRIHAPDITSSGRKTS
jgi:hypothetical protein